MLATAAGSLRSIAANTQSKEGGEIILWVTNAQAVSRTPSSANFVDVTSKLGIHFKQEASPTSRKYLLETMGSGVALFDYDNDGRLDIFLGNGAEIDDPMAPGSIPKKTAPKYWNRLFHQKEDGSFEDVTEKAGLTGAGYTTGVAVGDYDNDGYEDLFVAGYGRNTLYHNNGDGTFADVTASAGVEGSGWSTSAAWIDYDNDGKLDLIVARYMEWTFTDIYCGEQPESHRAYCHPKLFKPASILLYHNEGNGKFIEVAQKAGASRPCKGLGVAIADYDRDGWTDFVISNDAIPEGLFHNKGNGTFEEIGIVSGAAVDDNGATFSGMGVDFEDYNNDGWPDIIITDLANQRYALFTNTRDGTFEYSSDKTGLGTITRGHSGWGVRFMDYDNDGWKDLFVVQAHVMDNIEVTTPNLHYRESPLLLHNEGGIKFTDVSASSGSLFQQKWASRSMAVGDINNDGRLDAVVTTNDGPAMVWMNEMSNNNNWISLKLVGVKSNRDGIGARVKVVTDESEQFATVTTAGSYQSSGDRRVHFGLGQTTMVKRIEISWPSRTVQVLNDVRSNQFLTITEATSGK
ncbi:MAG: CRTAC1 family protein [Terriglobales bacterium]